MPPDLVIADAPFKLYPGGVVAVRCSDWLAPGSGASTEADALSICGTVVRETQQVAAEMSGAFNPVAAYQEATDTLEIPLADIPLETGMAYRIAVSHKIEGDWNIDEDDPGTMTCWNNTFGRVLGIGLHGADIQTLASPWTISSVFLRNYPAYHTSFDLFMQWADPAHTISIRAFSQDDTTIEWLLDQLVFFPAPGIAPNWAGVDFAAPSGGDGGVFGTETVEPDGPDGGDDYGKFTKVIPRPNDALDWFYGSGGDVQQKADGDDAELLLRYTPEDFWFHENSVTDDETRSHCYSLHHTKYRPAGVIAHDDFARTIISTTHPGDLGICPEGFGYVIDGTNFSGSPQIVNLPGGILVMSSHSRVGGTISARWGQNVHPGGANANHGANLSLYDQYDVTGRFRLAIETNAGWRTSDFFGVAPLSGTNQTFVFGRAATGSDDWFFEFEHRDLHWRMFDGNDLSSWVDVSSWYTDGDWVRFRVEIKRHVIRARVWEDGTTEPSTWDYEGFLAANSLDYPYGDDPDDAQVVYASRDIELRWVPDRYALVDATFDMHWDDLEISRDPGGEPTETFVRLADANDVVLGDQEVPYGAGYFIYWGTGDFTDQLPPEEEDDSYYLDFDVWAWNSPGAPDMQRSEVGVIWFRSIHVGIVSMNWRQADRKSTSRRILVEPL